MLLTLALLVALQDSKPASAPASRPALPAEIRVGVGLTIPLEGVPEAGIVWRLNISAAEPLTLLADSCDCDVALAVEDEKGNVLAGDDDSGVETNAHLTWQPERPGVVRLRFTAKPPRGGTAAVYIVRGAVAPAPADPALAAISFWDVALYGARLRRAVDRESLALDRLASVEGRASAEEARVARLDRDRAVTEARTMLRDAGTAERARDFPRARDLAAKAIERTASGGMGASDATLAVVAWDAALLAYRLGDLRSARDGWSRTRDHWERTLVADHPNLQAARHNFAMTIQALGDLPGARALQEKVLEVRTRTLNADHRDLQAGRMNLAISTWRLGDLAGARKLQEQVLEVFERTLPAESSDLLNVRNNLAGTLQALGDLTGARALYEKVLAVRERILPADHTELLASRANLAQTIAQLGDLRGARVIEEQVLAARERALPADHPDVQAARHNLAVRIKALGDLAGARKLQDQVVEVFERTHPNDHPELQKARQNLALTLHELGDLRGARALAEKVLEVRERIFLPDHPDVQTARQNLGMTMLALGDLPAARALFEKALSVRERILPADHPDLHWTRLNLAVTIKKLGDFPGARALEEKVLEIRERTFPADDPDLQGARHNLAATLNDLGDFARARVLFERVLESRSRTFPADHPDLQRAREGLAGTMKGLGDYPTARALQEKVLEVRERTLPPDHPDLQATRHNLALTVRGLGDLPRARELQEKSNQVLERTHPDDHPALQLARMNLASTLARVGAPEPLGKVLDRLTRGAIAALAAARALSPREAVERASGMSGAVDVALSMAELSDRPASLAPELFRWVEQRRAAASAEALPIDEGAEASEISTLREAVRQAQRRMAESASGASEAIAASRPAAERIAEEVFRRDAAERALRGALTARGLEPAEIDAARIAAALDDGSAAAGYCRYARYELHPDDPLDWIGAEALLAHVVRRDGSLTRVELGPMEPIEEAIRRWREAIGSPLDARGSAQERGVGAVGPVSVSAREAGEALRQLVLDPVLAAAGGAKTLHVCADDELHVVPLDALPMGEGVVGDKVGIRSETSFARTIHPRAKSAAAPALLAVGGVDYGAEANATSSDAVAPPVTMERSGAAFGYAPLAATSGEARAIAAAFRDATGADAKVLGGKGATKSAFTDAVKGARFVHVATHGYFSDAGVEVAGEEDAAASSRPALWPRESLESRVRGMSPMSLCGLALAGANRGADSMGRVPGILTAEELAGLDLRNCDLAVLSACETNVGIHRAGLGISSLQSALHAAGARTAITSLWKVPDETTRELMTAFYRRLWLEKKPAVVALWEAKQVIRAKKGTTLRDWAGWVLTGDPGDEPERAASRPASRPAEK